jgi:hypothetical protein
MGWFSADPAVRTGTPRYDSYRVIGELNTESASGQAEVDAIADAHAHIPQSPVVRAVGLAIFILPIAYVAEILSVAVHEILGHGLSAVALGGTFSGFVLKWDAMGWASCALPAPAPLSHQVLYLASGVIATTVCGAGLYGLVFLFRKRVDIQLVLLVASFISLMDGISYVLWNAYHPVPPGDIGWIVVLCSDPRVPEISAVRWVLLVISALLFAGMTLGLCTSVFVRIEALVLQGGQFRAKSRVLALLLLLALPGSVGWLTFDWDQLAPGIGLLPDVAGVLSVITVATLLFWYRPKLAQGTGGYVITWCHVTVSWIGLIGTLVALALWFEDGVRWN